MVTVDTAKISDTSKIKYVLVALVTHRSGRVCSCKYIGYLRWLTVLFLKTHTDTHTDTHRNTHTHTHTPLARTHHGINNPCRKFSKTAEEGGGGGAISAPCACAQEHPLPARDALLKAGATSLKAGAFTRLHQLQYASSLLWRTTW